MTHKEFLEEIDKLEQSILQRVRYRMYCNEEFTDKDIEFFKLKLKELREIYHHE